MFTERTHSDFSSLKVSLQKETKHLEVVFLSSLDEQMVIELEQLLAWVAGRVEIHSIVFLSSSPSLRVSSKVTKYSCGELGVFLSCLRKLVVGMLHLPQTVVMDMGEGCRDLACEFFLGGDIRVAKEGASLYWDAIERGRSPCSGGSSFLPLIVGDALARKWLLGSDPVESAELLHSGFLSSFYKDQEEELGRILFQISLQAPVARIQTKRALLEPLLEGLSRGEQVEKTIAGGALLSGDYRRDPGDFCSAQDFIKTLSNSSFS